MCHVFSPAPFTRGTQLNLWIAPVSCILVTIHALWCATWLLHACTALLRVLAFFVRVWRVSTTCEHRDALCRLNTLPALSVRPEHLIMHKKTPRYQMCSWTLGHDVAEARLWNAIERRILNAICPIAPLLFFKSPRTCLFCVCVSHCNWPGVCLRPGLPFPMLMATMASIAVFPIFPGADLVPAGHARTCWKNLAWYLYVAKSFS